MALAYVGGITNGGAGDTGSTVSTSLTALTGGLAAAAATDDIVIAAFNQASDTLRTLSFNTSGYTSFGLLQGNDTLKTNLISGYKIMGATPDTTVVFNKIGDTSDCQCISVQVWRGVDLTTPMDVTVQTVAATDGGYPTPPAITPSTAGAVVICIGATAHQQNTSPSANIYTSSDSLSPFIGRNQEDTASNGLIGMGAFAWTSGTFTPATWGASVDLSDVTNSRAAVSAALRPAGAAVTARPFRSLLGVGK